MSSSQAEPRPVPRDARSSSANRSGHGEARLARWQAARAGSVAVAPIVLGVIPFGLIAGAAAVERGLTVADAIALSVGVFAGASQLAAIEVLGSGGSVAVAVAAALIINLRMMMYSASLSPWFARESLARRGLAAYVLTDQAYAVSVTRFSASDAPELPPHARLFYYLGAGATLWVTWQACTVAGALLGGGIPDSVPLGFAIPLVFLTLLPPAVTDRPTIVAALVGATVATLGAALPAHLGMLSGAICGVAAGTFMALRRTDESLEATP